MSNHGHQKQKHAQNRISPNRPGGDSQDEFESAETLSATTDKEEDLDDAGLPPKPGVESKPAPQAEPQARVYRNSQVIDHDLFKLRIATMRKNVSWTDKADIQLIEHVHMFHTVDSSGKKLTACGQVGGHHHDVEVIGTGPDGVPQLKVSGPRKYVRHRKLGKISVPLSELGDEDGDFHTHKVDYLGSEKIQIRQVNIEYAKFAAAQAALQAPSVDGVTNR